MADAKPNKSPVPISAGSLVLAAVMLFLAMGGIAFFYWLSRPPQVNNTPPALTLEATAYLENLRLSEVKLQASESAVNLRLVEVLGKITNHGKRDLALVEVVCIFHDVNGQILKRERGVVAGRKNGPLTAGSTQQFRLAFDDVPQDWNQAMPDLVIAQIRFA